MPYKSLDEKRKYDRDYYGNHSDRLKQYAKKQHAARKRLIQSYKNVPCMDCGVKYPPYVMHFDHRDRSTKSYNLGSMTRHSTSKVLAEIAKCDVVCANCHAERTWGAQ